MNPADLAQLKELVELVELGERMRNVDKAAADAWNLPTDFEHDRLCTMGDELFVQFGHEAEKALCAMRHSLENADE